MDRCETNRSNPICTVDLGDGNPVVVGRPDGFQICRDLHSQAVARGFVQQQTSDCDTIGHLLMGCIAAGHPVQRSARAAPKRASNLHDYVFDLCGNYHSAHAAPINFRIARRAFSAIGDQRSADFAAEKSVEESGHDVLALNDLESMGLPGDLIVERIRPHKTRRLVELFDRLVRSERPYRAFGYFYALERMCLGVTRERINYYQAMAPRHINITSCLRTHSSIGADVSHVAEGVAFIAGLPTEDRNLACQGAYEVAKVVFHDHVEDIETRAELDRLLADWQWVPFEGVRSAVA